MSEVSTPQEKQEERLVKLENLVTKTMSTDERVQVISLLSLEMLKTLTKLSNSVDELNKFLIKENPAEIMSQRKLVPTVGTAVQLPPVDIPYDYALVIGALSTNTGTIRVGNSKVEAEDSTLGFPLLAGESVSYKIRQLSQLWIDATVSGEGVIWTVEK